MIQCDVLIVDDNGYVHKVVKEKIHGGPSCIPRPERTLPDQTQVPVYTHEVHPRVWVEHFHATDVGRVVSPTPGGGPLLKALLQQEVLGLLLCRTNEHRAHLEEYAARHIRLDAMSNQDSRFYMPRAKVIAKLGLAPDGGFHAAEESDSEPEPPQVVVAPIVKAAVAPPATAVVVESTQTSLPESKPQVEAQPQRTSPAFPAAQEAGVAQEIFGANDGHSVGMEGQLLFDNRELDPLDACFGVDEPDGEPADIAPPLRRNQRRRLPQKQNLPRQRVLLPQKQNLPLLRGRKGLLRRLRLSETSSRDRL